MPTTEQILHASYPEQVAQVNESNDLLPRTDYGVYILTLNDKAIVVGHGKYNRARVIFDNLETITKPHIKAIFVRLYQLFGEGEFRRYHIRCSSKEESQKIEKDLHEKIGGDSRQLSPEILEKLFEGIEPESTAETLLKIALVSSFDGLSDLRLWRRKWIINDSDWGILTKKLKL
jgi:hypothetical protein